MATNGSELVANALFTDLLVGEAEEIIDLDTINIPDLFTTLTRMEVSDITTGVAGGEGAFDKIMAGIRAHLEQEYKTGRITGGEYTKAFIALTEAGIAQSVQFILNRDSAYWGSLLAQVNAQVSAQLNVLNARVALKSSKAEYALTKLKLATEDANYALIGVNKDLAVASEALTVANKNLAVLKLETENATISLLGEQREAQRAQTMGTRTDGAAVSGVIGMQTALYDQQITSYQRDAEIKAAKPFIDAWITMKSIDEGLTAPTGFSNSSLDTVLSKIKLNNGLT